MEWTDATSPRLPEVSAPMQQHPAYARACTALGQRVRWLRLGPAGAPTGMALVLCRRWPGLGDAALVSRGPVWSDDLPPDDRRAALDGLIVRLRKDHAAVVVTPDPVAGQDPLRDTHVLPLVTPMTVAQLDLGGTATARRARLRGKWRNALVRAEAAPLSVTATRMPPNVGHWLLRHEAAQARERRYRRLPAAFAAAWARMSPDDTVLMTALDATGPVAGMLFLRHGGAATYHTGWTDGTGRAAGAHTRLMWEAMTHLADAGVTLLELDLIDTHSAPGIARFKLGTGAVAVTLGATRIAAPGTAFLASIARAMSRPAIRSGQRAAAIIR